MTLEKNPPLSAPESPTPESLSTPEQTEAHRMNLMLRLGHWVKETWAGRITATAAGIGLVTGIAVTSVDAAGGFSSPDKQTVATSTPQAGESASPTPSDAPSQETTPSPEATAPSNQAEIAQATQERQKYMTMSVPEFAALPGPEKAVFVVLTNKIYMQSEQESWQKYTKDPNDVDPVVTVDSSPQDIANSANWQQRLTYLLTGDERDKYMLATYWSGASSPSYAVVKGNTDNFSGSTQGSALAYNDRLPNPTVVGSRPVDHGLNGIISRDIDISDSTNANAVGTFTYYFQQVSLPDGTSEGLWIKN